MTDYYDLDTILAEEAKVTVIFKTAVHGLGWLDANNGSLMDGKSSDKASNAEEDSPENEDLQPGASVEMPLWLAEMLVKKGLAAIVPPLWLDKAVRRTIRADPVIADINQFCPYYFEVGKKISELMEDQGADITESLTTFLVHRLRYVLDESSNVYGQISKEDSMKKLTVLERRIFEDNYAASQEFLLWKRRLLGQMATAQRSTPSPQAVPSGSSSNSRAAPEAAGASSNESSGPGRPSKLRKSS